MNLHTADFDYHLPPERIAQTPVEPRDASRLLVLHRATGELQHRVFRDLVSYLRPGDLLVANDSRVLPGRLWARKPTGGRVELLLLREIAGGWWESLVRPINRIRPGQRLTLVAAPDADEDTGSRTAAALASPAPPPALPAGTPTPEGQGPDVEPDVGIEVEIGERTPAGAMQVRFSAPLEAVVARYGHVPLPPYIRTPLADPERYQTVYARLTGSAAAPTAGLHFTPALLDALAARRVGLAFVTLHVGPDTFRPVRAERVAEHDMHAELATVPAATAAAIAATKAAGGRVIAVGTTAVRALESWAAHQNSHQELRLPSAARAPSAPTPTPAALLPDASHTPDRQSPEWSDWTRLFIYPGYRFQVVDALVTNFHLPRSTLLMLVSAFAGADLVRHAYDTAIADGYRFYSFGDACLIL